MIGVQVFGKEPSFDPRTDPIVRVQARRLRARLVRYYREEGQPDEVIVDLPKGGYAPVFRRRDGTAPIKPSLSATLVSRNTVAVLPFADYSPGATLDYFCRGLRDEIVHTLTSLKTLRVLGAKPDDAADQGERGTPRHDAALVINGSVRAAGDRLRVTTQLVDGTQRLLLVVGFDRRGAGGSLRGAGDDRQARSSTSSQPELLDADNPPGARRPSDNLAARNLFLQGRYHLNQRTEEGLHKAVDFFEKAIVEDAQFSLAHSGLADAYGLLTHYGVLGPAAVWAQGGVERGIGGDARRSLGRGAHVAGPRARDAGLGLGRRRTRVPARDSAESAVPDRPSLVCDVVPGADGTARRGARADAARAVARSGVVDHRARSGA